MSGNGRIWDDKFRKILKLGSNGYDSLAVVIPYKLVEELKLKSGDVVKVQLVNKQILITKKRRK